MNGSFDMIYRINLIQAEKMRLRKNIITKEIKESEETDILTFSANPKILKDLDKLKKPIKVYIGNEKNYKKIKKEKFENINIEFLENNHAKLILNKKDKKRYSLLTGSANITYKGINKNTESFVVQSTDFDPKNLKWDCSTFIKSSCDYVKKNLNLREFKIPKISKHKIKVYDGEDFFYTMRNELEKMFQESQEGKIWIFSDLLDLGMVEELLKNVNNKENLEISINARKIFKPINFKYFEDKIGKITMTEVKNHHIKGIFAINNKKYVLGFGSSNLTSYGMSTKRHEINYIVEGDSQKFLDIMDFFYNTENYCNRIIDEIKNTENINLALRYLKFTEKINNMSTVETRIKAIKEFFNHNSNIDKVNKVLVSYPTVNLIIKDISKII